MADRDQRDGEDNSRHRGWTTDEPDAGGDADPRRPGQSTAGQSAAGQGAPDQAPDVPAGQGYGQQAGGEDVVRGQNSYAPGAEIWQEGSNYNPTGCHQGAQSGFPSQADAQGGPSPAQGGDGDSGYDTFVGGQGAGQGYSQGGADGGPGADQGGGSYGQRDFGPGAQRSHFQQDQHHGDPGAAGRSSGQQPPFAERQGPEAAGVASSPAPQDQGQGGAAQKAARTLSQEKISASVTDVADGGVRQAKDRDANG